MVGKSRLARFKFWTDLIVKLVVVAVLAAFAHRFYERHHQPLEIAIILPLSGQNEAIGAELKDAYRLAVDEINAAGGIKGRRIDAQILDTQSSSPVARAGVERVLEEENVVAFFGCRTSSCRRAVLPAIQAARHLLIFPGDYEGMEFPSHAFYTGSPPNQLIVPALEWAFGAIGHKFFVVGVDDVYPRVAAEVIARELEALNGELVGTSFVPPGTEDMAEAAEAIKRAAPDVVLSLSSGSTTPGLVHAMRAAGLSPYKIPTVHMWMGDDDIRDVGAKELAGDYLAGSYFSSLDSDANRQFRHAYRTRYGKNRQFGSPEESAYVSVKMWAAAVERAGSASPRRVVRALRGLHYEAPSGPVHLDRSNHHLWRIIRVGRIDKGGRVALVWESDSPLEPLSYPISGTQEEWDELLLKLNRKWRGDWAAPRALQ
jgi:urea transport system substrate-binding protein